MKNSIAVRLAAMFALAALGGFLLIGAALHRVLEVELERHQREQLNSRALDIGYMLTHARLPGSWQRLRDKLDALTPINGSTRFWIWSEDPAFRYNDDVESVLAATGGSDDIVEAAIGPDGDTMKVLSKDFAANSVRPAVRLMIGVDAEPFKHTLQNFETALAGLMFGGIGLVAALGYWIARVGLRPVDRLTLQAREIGPRNRAQRLQLPELAPELAELGHSFNAALDRLDGAYQQLEVFNADVAHELRTPLANLIGQTQVTLSRERTSAQLRGVLESNLEELERLRAIVADMLFLARADQGARALRKVDASLADEVGKTVEFLEMLLDDAGLSVRVLGDAYAPIETSLLRRALTNLLQNAIQHSKPRSEIVVTITSEPTQARIAFANASEPLAPEQLARLFDRFYRVDSSRPHSNENHGLGLSIVKAIALMHGGEVFASSVAGITTIGLTVRIDETAAADGAPRVRSLEQQVAAPAVTQPVVQSDAQRQPDRIGAER